MGFSYAVATLPGADPIRGPGNHAAPHKYRKPAFTGPVFPCIFAVASLEVRDGLFLPGNINILPRPISPVLGRLEPSKYAHRTIYSPGRAGWIPENWKNLENIQFLNKYSQKMNLFSRVGFFRNLEKPLYGPYSR